MKVGDLTIEFLYGDKIEEVQAAFQKRLGTMKAQEKLRESLLKLAGAMKPEAGAKLLKDFDARIERGEGGSE